MISYLNLVIIFVYFLIKVLSVVLSMLGTNLNHGNEMKSIKVHLENMKKYIVMSKQHQCLLISY